MFKKLNSLLKMFGIDFHTMLVAIAAMPWYLACLRQAKRQSHALIREEFPFGKLYPCLADRSDDSGVARGHYFHQDLLVARKIFAARPVRHVDVGSRIDGFVAHVASFREIEVLDIRALPATSRNIVFRQADLMASRPDAPLLVCDSLSCLHALEHFGLGRYGDQVNLNGHKTGFANMAAMLKPGGTFYLSVPMGAQRIEFNAHRVFALQYLLDMVQAEFTVQSFSYVDDDGDLHEDEKLVAGPVAANFNCHYGCAILELVKKR